MPFQCDIRISGAIFDGISHLSKAPIFDGISHFSKAPIFDGISHVSKGQIFVRFFFFVRLFLQGEKNRSLLFARAYFRVGPFSKERFSFASFCKGLFSSGTLFKGDRFSDLFGGSFEPSGRGGERAGRRESFC